MSILLDSLRKSEAQRNIGETPSIHSAQDYENPGKRGGGLFVWLLIALTAAAIVWFVWQQYGVLDDSTAVTQAEPGNSAVVASADSPPAAGTPMDTQPSSGQRTPVEQLADSQTADSTDSPAGEPVARVAEYVPEPVEPVATDEKDEDEQEPGENMTAAANQALEVDLEEVVAAQAEAQERLANEQENEVDSPDRDTTTQRRASRSRAESTEPQPESYWQLPQRIREDLPEFRITVLVYAEAPEDRFLLMNGERLREEDELEGGIVLKEIRRDGAVFAYGSRSFLVKN